MAELGEVGSFGKDDSWFLCWQKDREPEMLPAGAPGGVGWHSWGFSVLGRLGGESCPRLQKTGEQGWHIGRQDNVAGVQLRCIPSSLPLFLCC